MKFRKHSFLLVFVLFVVLLFFCVTNNEALTIKQTVKDIEDKIKVEPGVDKPDKRKKEVAEKIKTDYEDLSCYFEENKFNKMAKLLGERATIVTPEGYTLQGKKAIEGFWKIVRKDYDEVEFELSWASIIYEEETVGVDKFNNISYETFEFHLIKQNKGKTLQNQTGSGSSRRRHRLDCQWFRH